MNLVPCHECGQLISPNSSSCVKCESYHPFARCRLCGKAIKPSEAFHPNVYSLLHEIVFFHFECVRRMLPVPRGIACPDCGASLESQCPVADSIELRWNYTLTIPITCNVCGNTDPWGLGLYSGGDGVFCSWCGFRVFRRHEKTEHIIVEEWCWFHKSCAPAWKKKHGFPSGTGCLIFAAVPILAPLTWAIRRLV